MLVSTRSTMFRINDDDSPPTPLPLPEGAGVRRVADGQSLHVIVLDGGRLLVRQNAADAPAAMPYDSGIAERIECLLILSEDPVRVLLGTQGAHLYRFDPREPGDPPDPRKAGVPAERVEGFERVEGRERWHTPWGGPPAVRSLASSGEIGGAATRATAGGESPPARSSEPSPPSLGPSPRGRGGREDPHPASPSEGRGGGEDPHTHSRSPLPAPGGKAHQLIYADIHVGCVVRSDDGGESWQPTCRGIDEDVHQVATCPAAPRRVYANTASGVYVSDDAGGSWEHRAADLGNRYGRAIAVHPGEPDVLLASVSDGPRGGNAQLFVSRDAGRRWTHVSEGFPASLEQNIDTFHLAFTGNGRRGRGWAVAGRALYVGEEGASRWRRYWEAPEAIVMLG